MLARLIRRGLWNSEDKERSRAPTNKEMRQRSRKKGKGTGLSSESSTGEEKNTKRGVVKGEETSQDSQQMNKEDGKGNKKTKKRITFKLDNEDDNYRAGEEFDNDGGSSGAHSASGIGGSGGSDIGVGTGDGMPGLSNTSGGRSSLLGKEGSHLDGLEDGANSDGSFSRLKGTDTTSINGGLSNDLSKEKSQNGLFNDSGNESMTKSLNETDMGFDGLSSGLGDGRERTDSLGSKSNLLAGCGQEHGKIGGKNALFNQVSPSASMIGNGDTNSGSGGPDYGKRVRKAVGYMRSASPSGSEWGDPSHARPYATAQVPPLTQKPKIDFSTLLGRFELTPAWTFSYHNHIPAIITNRREAKRKTP